MGAEIVRQNILRFSFVRLASGGGSKMKVFLRSEYMSQASAGDGQIYDVDYSSAHNENTGTYFREIQDGSDN